MTLATGDIVNGSPIVCSGYKHASSKGEDNCYLYSKEGKAWAKYIQTISSKVYYASSFPLSNALFVTGGYERQNKLSMNTTNLVFTNGTIKNGPDLPKGQLISKAHFKVFI